MHPGKFRGAGLHVAAGPQLIDQLCAELLLAKRFISGQCHEGQFHRLTVASQVREIFSFQFNLNSAGGWNQPTPPISSILQPAYPS